MRVVVGPGEPHDRQLLPRARALRRAAWRPAGRRRRTRRERPAARPPRVLRLADGAARPPTPSSTPRAELRFYLYLALTGAFFENHCSGFGTNSTPNHLLLVGGQSPTLKNPPRGTTPEWDMPSRPGLAEDNGIAWRAYAAADDYPGRLLHPAQGLAERPRRRAVRGRRRGRRAPAAGLRMARPTDDEHPPANVTDGHERDLAVGRRGGPGRRLARHGVPAHLGRLGRLRRPRPPRRAPSTRPTTSSSRSGPARAAADVRRAGEAAGSTRAGARTRGRQDRAPAARPAAAGRAAGRRRSRPRGPRRPFEPTTTRRPPASVGRSPSRPRARPAAAAGTASAAAVARRCRSRR